MSTELEIEAERITAEEVRLLVERLADVSFSIWHWGDGYGGHVKELLRVAIESRGLKFEEPPADPRISSRKAISRYTREIVIARDGLACTYCKTVLHPSEVTLDHKHAHSKGGSDDPENLCVACRKCNSGKGSRDQQEFQRIR